MFGRKFEGQLQLLQMEIFRGTLVPLSSDEDLETPVDKLQIMGLSQTHHNVLLPSAMENHHDFLISI